MNKKLLAIFISSIVATPTLVSAQDITKTLKFNAYGKAGVTYSDASGDFETDSSTLNLELNKKINKKHFLKLNLASRAKINKDDFSYEYDFFADEVYYSFVENETAELKLGRFYNPVGLNGENQYDYSKHPFTVKGNQIKSVDGIMLGYNMKLQKDVYAKLDVFVGTLLSDQIIDGKEVDTDTSLNYGANVKFISRMGKINFGLYASNNGKELVIDDVNEEIPDEPMFYQANVGYEYSEGRLYSMVEYNRYEYNYDDDIDNELETFDSMIGYKIGNFMPAIGYEFEEGTNYMNSSSEEKDISTETLKLGLRYTINKNLTVMFEYKIESDNKISSKEEQKGSLDLAFNF